MEHFGSNPKSSTLSGKRMDVEEEEKEMEEVRNTVPVPVLVQNIGNLRKF